MGRINTNVQSRSPSVLGQNQQSLGSSLHAFPPVSGSTAAKTIRRG